jgi:hypothetical protein
MIMRRFNLFAAGITAALLSSAGHTAIISVASDVELSGGAKTFSLGSSASYTFNYLSSNFLSPVTIAMSGTGQVYGNGFFSPNGPDPLQIDVLVPDQLSLGEFFTQVGAQPIPYSIAQSSVALRFTDGGQTYYGYATVGGSRLIQLAYNNVAGGKISTAQSPDPVPEPATWAIMVLGFGMVGGTMRRAQARTLRFA